ncbi:HD-GYP domain-containing protein [Seleniivibrio woodruffii]|uniref:HD domain-containing protein n=1 Tax=Seleniivibrio woodruffii TaxID=1078050 RepID=A0A4R1K8R7_9BACT|nr:HD domain-containing phosphohydrolase [Seleniivibrio woodruffii]TCK60387.1 HD domain-containing protein [Seleniivibrio woodruffii]TVZ36014.1 HD domain-containing protein [Seleniivibrio woodruffii]
MDLKLDADSFDLYVTSSFDVAYALSRALDLVNPLINNHHQRVAFIAGSIAAEAGMSRSEIEDIILASLIHDIGVVMESEFLELADVSDKKGDSEYCHAIVGSHLLSSLDLFPNLPALVKYHHSPYGGEINHLAETCDEVIPEGAMIIHLSDRIDVLLHRGEPALDQRIRISENVNRFKGTKFSPEHLAAFNRLAERESFWFDIEEQEKYKLLKHTFRFSHINMDIDKILETAKLLSRIIDFRCVFTANHSAGVAAAAKLITEKLGFPEKDCKSMMIAGYLHDIGKLGIPSAILYKQGALDEDEKLILRKHPYYTFSILNTFQIFDKIKNWAAFHHEYLDGSGYPFHLNEERLDLGCRIMAIADIVTALTEERPYRESMPKEQVAGIVREMVESGKLDSHVASAVLDNFEEINDVRQASQAEEMKTFERFKDTIMRNSICKKNMRFITALQ